MAISRVKKGYNIISYILTFKNFTKLPSFLKKDIFFGKVTKELFRILSIYNIYRYVV
jgi:hypothetical protein